MTGAGRSVVRMPPLGVRHGEPAHEPEEVAILVGPEQDVEVVGHQAVSQQSHVMAHDRLREERWDAAQSSLVWKIANRTLARFRAW